VHPDGLVSKEKVGGGAHCGKDSSHDSISKKTIQSLSHAHDEKKAGVPISLTIKRAEIIFQRAVSGEREEKGEKRVKYLTAPLHHPAAQRERPFPSF